MKIIEVQLPDGRVVEIPSDALASSPETSFADKFATNLYTGAGKLGAGLANFPVTLGRLLEKGLDTVGVPKKSDSWLSQFNAPNVLDDVIASHETKGKKEGFQNPYGRAAVEALAGIPLALTGTGFRAVSGNLLSQEIPAQVTTGAEQLIHNAGPGIEKGYSWVPPVLGLLTGFGSGMLFGPSLPQAERRVSSAVRGMSPGSFNETRGNASLLSGVGAETGTLADIVPGNRLLSLGNETRSFAPDGSFAARVAGRGDDLSMLGRQAIEAAGPIAAPEAVGSRVALAANRTMADARETASSRLAQDLSALPNIPQPAMEGIYNNVLNWAHDPAVTQNFDRTAMQQIAEQLVAPNHPGRLIQNPPQLQRVNGVWRMVSTPPTHIPGFKESPADISLAIARWKNAQGTSLDAQGAANIDRASKNIAEGVVNPLIEANAPGYLDAKAAYRDNMQNTVNAMDRGPIGAMAGNKIGDPNPLAVGRMDSVLSQLSPEGVRDTIGTLARTEAQQGPTNLPQQIASAIIQRRLDKGATSPGATVRGTAGFPKDERFNAILDSAGIDSTKVTKPLEAADLLQNFQNPNVAMNDLPMSKLSMLVRPFRTGDFLLTKNMRDKYYNQIGDILSDTSPEGIQRLEMLANFNPEVRRQLALISALNGMTK